MTQIKSKKIGVNRFFLVKERQNLRPIFIHLLVRGVS
jgi:hypothetical protein